ncbi:MAG TPA: NAD(P)-dependent oxidoreductase [Steroidobacteraceae bacterium]
MKIGLVGLGRMGGAMARRLLSQGYELAVFHPNPQQTTAFAALGASIARDLAELCHGRELLISALPSDESLESVTLGPGGVIDSLAPAAMHMVTGTHGVPIMEKLVAAHERARQVLLSCPLLGRPERAAAGTLGLIAAGPAAAIARITPVLKSLTEHIFLAGDNPLSAVAIKIANNFVLGCAIEAMGEGMALVRRYGVDAELFREVLTQGLFNCTAYQVYGDVIAKQDWGRVGAAASVGLKDARLALQAGERARVPLPSGQVWHDHLASACERGEAALDWSVMAREQFRRSGLE